MLKLSQAQAGKQYKVIHLTLLKSLSKRLAIFGLNTGVLIEILALYKHGAVIKTASGNIALGADVLDFIQVKMA
ncbi:MAG: FeoA domain-containing protein [Alcanivoracaceae bacterium]|nr:FeoA domain-containing protein [Alcanivoracaceae bacterium]